MGHVLVYVPERAIRQVQKNVCLHFHYNVPEEEEDGLRQGEDKHHDSSKPWQLYLLPYHCSLGKVKAKLPKQSPTKDLNTTKEGEGGELDLCKRHWGAW